MTYSLIGQRGYSSASMGMSKQKCDHAVIPQPDEIILEEYINYHTHRINLPKAGKSVALDMRWGNSEVSATSPEAILQVGISTSRIEDYKEIIPVNVSLVIDKSGSMSRDQRLEKAKDAMMAVVKKLRPQDRLSIVEFDHVANVVLQAQSVSNMSIIESAIRSIRLGGSTNLHDGISKGYQEILKNYSTEMTNRIIILTDALTNTGVVDPEEIIKANIEYKKERQIDFAMIGVGVDFNYALSRQITANGKNQIHFINDADDIKKIFIDEVESLLSPVAYDPVLEIEFGDQLELVEVFGYEPNYGKQHLTMNLNNMNAGLTQVVLLKVKARSGDGDLKVKTRLKYYDVAKRKKLEIKESVALNAVNDWGRTAEDILKEPEVRRNFAIAEMAVCLKDMAEAFAINKACVARKRLTETTQKVNQEFAVEMDPDVKRMLDILQTYLDRLTVLANVD